LKKYNEGEGATKKNMRAPTPHASSSGTRCEANAGKPKYHRTGEEQGNSRRKEVVHGMDLKKLRTLVQLKGHVTTFR
jgi:hypothetical protein